jgi:putative redox protein
MSEDALSLKTRVIWIDNVKFVGESGSGHAAVMDGAAEVGGANLGIRPMEMILLGLGGCTAVDVLRFLRGVQQSVSDCHIDIDAKRADSSPMVFTHIHLHYVLTGKELDPTKVKLAIVLSRQKYCSASAMLGKTAEITHDFEIRAPH